MRKFPVDFQVSGHSHGGQIRLPGIGAPYLPPWARKYSLGHYQLGQFQLYTNRGIGVIGLPMRFMCPPEITIFTLKTG
jgi:predicted MPP superfamily phosphohydrolase